MQPFVFSLILSAALGAAPATRPYVESISVDLVQVPVVVRDQSGRPIRGLTASDFIIREDGRPQPIVSFTSEPAPASIVVALDNSRSMEGRLWSAQKAVAEFLEEQPGSSALSLLTFNDEVFLEQGFTQEAAEVARAAGAVRVEGTRTALYDALRIGSMHLSHRSGTRVLLLFTDGEDTVYEGDEGRLRTSIESAQAADVMVFAVACGAAAGATPASLSRMTQETGGELLAAKETSQMRSAFARITESLGSRYLLAYEPPDPKKPGYRSIEVGVIRSGATATARRGYVVR